MDNTLFISIMSIFIAILSVIVSLSGHPISSIFTNQNNNLIYRKQLKIGCLVKINANKYRLDSYEARLILNEIFIAFNGSREISRRLMEMQRLASLSGKVPSDGILDLVKLMMRDVGIDYSEVDDDFLMTPFRMDS